MLFSNWIFSTKILYKTLSYYFVVVYSGDAFVDAVCNHMSFSSKLLRVHIYTEVILSIGNPHSIEANVLKPVTNDEQLQVFTNNYTCILHAY